MHARRQTVCCSNSGPTTVGTTCLSRRRSLAAVLAGLALSLCQSLGRAQPGPTVPARPERIPVLEKAVGPRLASATQLRPVRLKSGTFAGAGALVGNLATAFAARPDAPSVHVLAQFNRVPDADDRARLELAGLTLLGYVPDGAYFANVRRSADLALAASIGLRWLGAVYPEDKLTETLLAGTPGTWAVEPDGRVKLRVWPFEDVAPESARAALTAAGAEVRSETISTGQFEVLVPPDRVIRLAELDEVRWLEETPPPIALFNDGLRTNMQVHEVEAAPYGLTGAGVAAGIWDGGWLDFAHPDFAGRALPGETNVAEFRHPHATHVAGTMGGSGAGSENAGGRPRQWRGVAPGLTIISYDVNTGPLIEEHREARERYGAVISQNSWGITVSDFFGNCHLLGDYAGEAPNYDRLVTGLYGAPYHVIFAVGNARGRQDSSGCPTPGGYRSVGVPATAKNILTVGAIHSDDNSMTVFSGWGPTDDGRLKPEIVAPGDEVGGDGGITSTQPDARYGVLVGTSMAAPAVSGATALLIEEYRNRLNGQTPLPALIKGLLAHTAADLDDATDWFQPGPDYASGYGRVRVRHAVDHLRGGGWLIGEVAQGENAVYTLTVPPDTDQVKVTLVWDDVPALQNAARTLVNDLDLVVTDPTGAQHFPWTLDPANPGAPATRNRADHLNVIEQVVADNGVTPGTWTVAVTGGNLPVGGRQKFALLFSPVGIPLTPLLVLEVSPPMDLPAGNGDGFLDRGEEVAERLVLRHTDGPGATNVSARLTTDSPWVQLLQAEAIYPNLSPGIAAPNLTPLTYRVSKNAPCGETLRFEHITAVGGVRLTNRFQRVVGRLEVTNVATGVFAAGDVPLSIPDTASVTSTLPVAMPGAVLNVKASVRLDHTWLDDLEIKLRAPDGGAVTLMPSLLYFGQNLGRGDCGGVVEWTRFDDAAGQTLAESASPFVGSFKPFEPLAGLTNRPLSGDWQLVITDTSAEDIGTLRCWELEIRYAQSGYLCEFFNRPPLAVDTSASTWFEYPINLELRGEDPDDDPLGFRIIASPRHGVLQDFDAATGTVRYVPNPGYEGPDSFTFAVVDGYATSNTGTVNVLVRPPSADLAVLPSLAPAPPRHDQPFELTLTVTNRGPNNATGVVLTGLLPEGVTVLAVEASQGTVSLQGRELTALPGTIPEGGSGAVRLTLRVAAPGTFLNRAAVTTGVIELAPADNTADFLIGVMPTANVALTMRAGADPTPVGQPLAFALSVTNTGPFTASNLVVTCALPLEVTFASATVSQGDWTHEAGVFRGRPGNLPVGAAAALELVVVPGQTGPLNLEAEVVAAEPDPVPDNNRVTALTEVRPVTDLQIAWQPAAGPVALGGTFTQVLVVTNRSAVPASDVRAQITLAAAASLVNATPSQGEATHQDEVVRWPVGALPAGAEARLDLVLRAEALGWLTNLATVTAFEYDAGPADNTAQGGVEVRTAADLAVGFTPPLGRVVLNQPSRYGLTVTNLGPGPASAVTFTHDLPDGFVVRSLAASQGTVGAGAGKVTAELGDLRAGDVAAVTVEVEPTLAGPVTGTASVSAFEVDLTPANNQAEARFVVEEPADLGVLLTVDPAVVLLSQTTTLTVVARNHGPYPATGVRVVSDMPPGLAAGEAGTSQGTVVNEPAGVTFQLGELSPGEAATGWVQVATTHLGRINTGATVSADQPDLNSANNRVMAAIEVLPAVDLVVTQHLPVSPAVVGREFQVLITVTNRGPLAATGVQLVDLLPDGLELLASQGTAGNCAAVGRTLECALGEIPPGAAADVTLTLRGSISGQFVNVVGVGADQADLVPTDNAANLVIPLDRDADLEVSCSSGPARPAVGQTVLVSVNVRNRGPFPASGVSLRALLPPTGTLQTVTPSQGTWEAQAGGVEVLLGELPLGGDATVFIELTPTVPGAFATQLEVTAAQPDLAPANNTCETAVEVQPSADLGVTLTAAPNPATPGTPLQTLVTVTNRGPETAREVVVTGQTPTGLEFISGEASQGEWRTEAPGWVWSVGTLPAGAAATLATRWNPTVLGLLTNIVVAASPELDSNPDDNRAELIVPVRLAADLVLSLDGPATPVIRGTATTYTFTLENLGPEPATAVNVTHPLPDFLALDALTPEAGEALFVAGQVTWRLPVLPAGGTARLRVAVTPQSSGVAAHTASALAFETDLTPANNQVLGTIEVFDLADLALAATATPAGPLLGQEVTLRLAVTNRGPHAATGVLLTNTLPAEVEFLGLETLPPAAISTNGAELVFAFERVEAGGEAVATLRVRFLTVGTNLGRASVGARPLDWVPENNALEFSLAVQPSADLQLALTVLDDPVYRDLPLRYLLVISNAGPNPAPAVRLTNPLPPGTTLLDVQTSVGAYEFQDGQLTYLPGDLAAGTTATLLLTVRPEQTGLLTNVATVVMADPDPRTENNLAAVVSQVMLGADLAVTLHLPPSPVATGEPFAYTVVVTNRGPHAATGVLLRDKLPGLTRLVAAVPSRGESALLGDTLVVTLGDLAPAAGATLDVTVVAEAEGELRHSAEALAAEFDPDPANNAAAAVTEARPAGDVALELYTDRDDVLVGRELSLWLVITNRGPHAATDVRVTNLLSDDAHLVRLETSAGAWTSTDKGFTGQLDNLAPGGVVTAEFALRAPAQPGFITNVATATVAGFDPVPTNNQVAVRTEVFEEADLLVLHGPAPASLLMSNRYTITVTVTNRGQITAPRAFMLVAFSLNIELLDAEFIGGTAELASPGVMCRLGDFPPGGSAVLNVQVRPIYPGMFVSQAALLSPAVDLSKPGAINRLEIPVSTSPLLVGEREGNRLILSWPALAADYDLEFSDDLSSAQWQPLLNPKIIVGDEVTVNVKLSSPARYFRLRKLLP